MIRFRTQRRVAAAATSLALALLLGACAAEVPAPSASPEPPPADPTLTEPTPTEPRAADTPAPPPGAIRVAPELYMQPMGTDERGCAVFQPWSPTMAVVQALHWRTADGTFTLDRNEAACADIDEPG